MRKIAFEYFSTQPWFQIVMSKDVEDFVVTRWLHGDELSAIYYKSLDTRTMIDSVKECKRWIVNTSVPNIDIDAEDVTKDIINGYFDYLKSIYDKYERLVECPAH